MKGLSGGECGVVGQTWCAKGNDITAASTRQYYAYCAERKGKQNFLALFPFLPIHKYISQCKPAVKPVPASLRDSKPELEKTTIWKFRGWQ